MATPCYWVEATGRWSRTLDVYELACGHDRIIVPYQEGDEGAGAAMRAVDSDWDAAPWPTVCPACGVAIDYDAARQAICGHTEYRRVDTGEVGNLRDFPPGAMWDSAPWRHDEHFTADGRRISVRLPNGHDWCIDSQASNCTRPEEDHDCWCRHGEPPALTVDKTPEPGRSTCQAGGGSIWANQGRPNDWHGFLTGGRLLLVGES